MLYASRDGWSMVGMFLCCRTCRPKKRCGKSMSNLFFWAVAQKRFLGRFTFPIILEFACFVIFWAAAQKWISRPVDRCFSCMCTTLTCQILWPLFATPLRWIYSAVCIQKWTTYTPHFEENTKRLCASTGRSTFVRIFPFGASTYTMSSDKG